MYLNGVLSFQKSDRLTIDITSPTYHSEVSRFLAEQREKTKVSEPSKSSANQADGTSSAPAKNKESVNEPHDQTPSKSSTNQADATSSAPANNKESVVRDSNSICPVCSCNNKSPRHISKCFLCQFCKTYRQNKSKHYKHCKMITGYSQDVIQCRICFKHYAKNYIQSHLRHVHGLSIRKAERPGPIDSSDSDSDSILQSASTSTPAQPTPSTSGYDLRNSRKRSLPRMEISPDGRPPKKDCPQLPVSLICHLLCYFIW